MIYLNFSSSTAVNRSAAMGMYAETLVPDKVTNNR